MGRWSTICLPPPAPTFLDAAAVSREISRGIPAVGQPPVGPKGNSTGNSPVSAMRIRETPRETTRLRIRDPWEFSGYAFPGKSPWPAPGGFISALVPGGGGGAFPLNFPAKGPGIPTAAPFRNIRRPPGRRGHQAGSRIRIAQFFPFLATVESVRKWGQK